MLKGIEFVQCVDNGVMHYKIGNELRLFNQNSKSAISTINTLVKDNYPNADARLEQRYCGLPHINYLKARRFVKCNLSLFDSVPDIDNDGKMHLEFVPCPLRGECDDEGVICKPKQHTALSDRHLEVGSLLIKGLTDIEIGDRLFISPLTVKSHVKSMLSITSCSNRTALANFLRNNNLV